MRKKWIIAIVTLVLAFALAVPAVIADEPKMSAEDQVAPKWNDVQKGIVKPDVPQLTDVQKNEIKAIYDQIFELKKQLVEKYQSYGVLSPEKAKKMLEIMEKRKVKAEENGYQFQFEKKGKRRKKF